MLLSRSSRILDGGRGERRLSTLEIETHNLCTLLWLPALEIETEIHDLYILHGRLRKGSVRGRVQLSSLRRAKKSSSRNLYIYLLIYESIQCEVISFDSLPLYDSFWVTDNRCFAGKYLAIFSKTPAKRRIKMMKFKIFLYVVRNKWRKKSIEKFDQNKYFKTKTYFGFWF